MLPFTHTHTQDITNRTSGLGTKYVTNLITKKQEVIKTNEQDAFSTPYIPIKIIFHTKNPTIDTQSVVAAIQETVQTWRVVIPE